MKNRPNPEELIGATYQGALEEAIAVLEEFNGEITDILSTLKDPALTVERTSQLQARVMVLYDAIGEVRHHLSNHLSFRVVYETCYGNDPAGDIMSALLRVEKGDAN